MGKVLEIGTGGYQAAVLSLLPKRFIQLREFDPFMKMHGLI
jgi:protein-L-isoaspartate O-methyltransferase